MKKKSTISTKSPAKQLCRKPGAVAERTKAPTKVAAGSRPPADPRLKIRRLKAQLAAALVTIDELRASADTDFLLGVLNRRGFERELTRSIAYINRYHATGALIMLDIDRLKPINDTFGHAAGDTVLKAVVEVLLRHVRASDVLARLGGDEFVLLLWNLSEAAARIKAAALEVAVDQLRFDFAGHPAAIGISAGVALLGPGTEANESLAEADAAMYARKAARKAIVLDPDDNRSPS
jgi:diguanylate cyclase (GGDEF)-like protein